MFVKNFSAQDQDKKIQLLFFLLVGAFVLLQSIYFSYRWVDDESWYLMPLPSIQDQGQFNIPAVPGDDVFWPQPPLLTYAESFVDVISPLSVTTARLLSLTAGIITIAVAFYLGKPLFGSMGGLLTAAIIAADNLFFLASRIVRPEIMVTLFFVLSIFYAIRVLDKQKQPELLQLALAAVFSALAIYSHPNGLFVPVSVVTIWLFCSGLNMDFVVRSLKYSALVFLCILPFVFWIVHHDGANDFASFKSHWLGRYGRNAEAESSLFSSLSALFLSEFQGRYASFIQFPFRLHIALVSVALVLLSLVKGPRLIKAVSVLVFIQLLFFIFVNNSNPSVRYMVTVVPLLAILGAYWMLVWREAYLQDRGLLSLALIAVVFLSLVASQVLGNMYYLWQSRDADYETVVAKVNALLPAESKVVYGGMFWWLGLRDHTLVPYMRTSWQRALSQWDPDFVIMDDWVMVDGLDDWSALRKELSTYLAEHGRLVGEVDGGFYGDLKIYEVVDP